MDASWTCSPSALERSVFTLKCIDMYSECEFVFNAYLSSTLIQELMNSLIYQYGIAQHVASTQEIHFTVESIREIHRFYQKPHHPELPVWGALDWPTDSKVEVLAWRPYPQKVVLQISPIKDQISVFPKTDLRTLCFLFLQLEFSRIEAQFPKADLLRNSPRVSLNYNYGCCLSPLGSLYSGANRQRKGVVIYPRGDDPD